jgi:hypothetical protein
MTVSTKTRAAPSAAATTKDFLAFDSNSFIRFTRGGRRTKKDPKIPGFEGSEDNIVDVHVRKQLPLRSRGRKWAEFPVIENPEFPEVVEFLGSRQNDFFAHVAAHDVAAVMSRQSAFFFDEMGAKDSGRTLWMTETRFFVAQLHARFAPDKPIYARFFGEKTYRLIERSELEQPAAGTLRYEHNYKLNFKAIACKAIDYIIETHWCLPHPNIMDAKLTYAERLKVQGVIDLQGRYMLDRSTFINEPWGLQTLFALRNATEAERSNLYDWFQIYPPEPNGPKMTFGKHVEDGMWIGSGKYSSKLNLQEEIAWVIHDSARLGLVDMKKDNQVRLTEAGLAFLDIMHTDNYDPDAFLRFTDPESLTMNSSQIDRIDAWMNRFFHKMKVKVDGLR